MTVSELQSKMRNELILGLDGINFTQDLAMMDRLDEIKNIKLQPLIDLINDLERRGVHSIPTICTNTFELVRESILQEYQKLGVI